jgi:hypothetical protein
MRRGTSRLYPSTYSDPEFTEGRSLSEFLATRSFTRSEGTDSCQSCWLVEFILVKPEIYYRLGISPIPRKNIFIIVVSQMVVNYVRKREKIVAMPATLITVIINQPRAVIKGWLVLSLTTRLLLAMRTMRNNIIGATSPLTIAE